MTRTIGYDVSTSMTDIRVRCPQHWRPAWPGTALHRGDEWGAYAPPACERCGRELLGLVLVDPE